MPKKILSGVILAAGFSKRAKCDKLLLAWKKHTLLYERMKQASFSKLDEVIIVIQEKWKEICEKYAQELRASCKKNIKIVVNNSPEQGMSSSLRLGVQNCDEKSQAVLFLLTDQPFFMAEDINTMYRAYQRSEASLLAACVGGKRKNPVLFSLEHYKEELLQVSGDQGARDVLKKYEHELKPVPFDNDLKCIDIDTQEEYQKYKNNLFSWHSFLAPYRLVSIMGAGGKTSLMWNIAQDFNQQGENLIFSTTTKVWNKAPKNITICLAQNKQDVLSSIQEKIQKSSLLLASCVNEEGKLLGFDPYFFSELLEHNNAKYIVEADGARSKYFKVHGDEEPCLVQKSDLIIITLGLNVLGKSNFSKYIHRPELLSLKFPEHFSQGKKTSVLKNIRNLSVKVLAEMLFAPCGYFAKVEEHSSNAPFILFLNHVESRKNYNYACMLIKEIKRRKPPKNLLGIVYGSNFHHDYQYVD